MSLAIGWYDSHSQTHRLLTDRRIVGGASLSFQPRAKIIDHSIVSSFEAVALVGDQRVYQLCQVQRGAYIAERIHNLRQAIINDGWCSASKTGAPSWNLAGLMVTAESHSGILYTIDGSFAFTKVSWRPNSMAFVGSGAEIGRAILFDATRTTHAGELRPDQIALRAMRAASHLRTDVGNGAALWVSGVPGVLEFDDLAECEAHLAGVNAK